jgi:putative oxidoreductase
MSSHKLLAYALPIRILAGIAFIAHGLPKFENVAGTQGFFGSIGLPPELAIPISQSVRSYWWNFSACWCSNKNNCSTFIIDMIGATLLVKISKGFVGGYELELLLMAVCISLLLTGPGRISIEWDVLKREIFPRGRALVEKQKQDVQESDHK